ncbi:LuxR C-terminal-related transcriptional regulator [Pseudomonas sp. JAI120]|uniref:LuxR C-terminal-related transcriptional regulator n=1 Tax=Pseudomonas sp. JAI120 TaxID=2723063 RepID=UPI0030DAF4AD
MGTIITFGKLQGRIGVLAEQELLASLAVCAGLANKEIARAVGCAPGTVKKSIERSFYKLGVSNRAALVAEAFRQGLVEFSCSSGPGKDPNQTEDYDQFQGTLIA